MQSKCELIEFKIPSFMYNIDVKNKDKKSRKVTFETNIKLSVSDKDGSKGIVCINTNVSDEEGEIKYSVEIKGIFKFAEDINTEEEKEEILKTEGFRELYSKLAAALEQIQNITNQELPNIPSVNDMASME